MPKGQHKTRPWQVKKICKWGHNIEIVGRDEKRGCNQCRLDRIDPVKRLYRAYKAKLKKHYGITPEEHQKMLEAANGICQLCLKPTEKFHIDHDHANGKARGLVCPNCNWGLGQFFDDAEALRRAADYIEAHRVLSIHH